MKEILEKINLKILSKIFVFFVVLSIVLGFGSLAFVSEASNELGYKSLTTIPGVTTANTTTGNTTGYINKIFIFSIGMAAVLAVLMITIGGFKYMAVESFSGKTDAKETITNAITGLVTLLFAWVLLNEINPQILSLKILGTNSITGNTTLGEVKKTNTSNNQTLTEQQKSSIKSNVIQERNRQIQQKVAERDARLKSLREEFKKNNTPEENIQAAETMIINSSNKEIADIMSRFQKTLDSLK